MVTIIDYGAGNIKSIQNMLKRIGKSSVISDKPDDILKAGKLILPGVGHFDHGMRNLHKSGLIGVLNQRVLEEKVPFLGICLGAQLIGRGSQEGVEKGLGWVDMDVLKFEKTEIGENLKIPHMGWNFVELKKQSSLLKGLESGARFYFVHSYFMKVNKSEEVLSQTKHGKPFDSAVEKDNIYGVQFHPEKSHKFGMQLLENFASL